MTDTKRFVLATFNPDKLKEIRSIWQDVGWELISLNAFPDAVPVPETGETFLDNALIKARAAFDRTRLPSVADDSGLEVDRLNGKPGVHSSRFAGKNASYAENNAKLLRLMEGVPEAERTARFRCVVALVEDGCEHWVEGTCEGLILSKPQGLSGFGYDPLFYLPETGKTFAEMTGAEKHAVSHRGEAFRRMSEAIRNCRGR